MARRRSSGGGYESQATLSVALAAVSAVGTLTAIALLARNFTDMDTFYVAYNPQSKWLIAFGGTLMLGLLAGAAGFLLGLNSANQKRNARSNLSWLGFFANAGLITVALCSGIFFYFTRFAVV